MSSRLLVVAATRGELEGLADVPGVELLACGIGPVEAATSVAGRLANAHRIGGVLHVGIAGCRRGSGLVPGDVVLGTSSRYCDTASQLVPRHLVPDHTLLRRVRDAVPAVKPLAIGTSADVGGTSHDTDVVVEAMEGFAVLRAAERAGIPAVELRVISNEVEESDRERWDFDLALGTLRQLLPPLVAALREE